MAGPYTLIPGTPIKLLDAATTGTGGVLELQGKIARLTIVAQGSGTISTGAVSLEEAFYDNLPPAGFESHGVPYTGTWSVISTVTGSALTTGAQQIFHIQGSVFAFRPRITTAIAGGGSMTIWAYGN